MQRRKRKYVEMNNLATMESVYEFINEKINDGPFERIYEKEFQDEILAKMKRVLDDGGDIDLIFPQLHPVKRSLSQRSGTILHYCIIGDLDRAAEYVLSRGANIAIERSFEQGLLRYRNAFEIAAHEYNRDSSRINLFQKLKNKTLQLYSSAYNLTPFHIDCAINWDKWSDRSRRLLRTAELSASVSVESPFWPGMTPIHIACKFENHQLVKRLLDLGAAPIARDPQGNTALHFVDEVNFYDERLFAVAAENTFGPFTGEDHFRIACKNCPQSLEIVKRYLDQGISPDSTVPISHDRWATGLHVATEKGCSDLMQLLLEYGADVNAKGSQGQTPVSYGMDNYFGDGAVECTCALIEAGSEQDRFEIMEFLDLVSSETDERKRVFVECVARLITLNVDLVSEELKTGYFEISNEMSDYWNAAEYTARCRDELSSLVKLGLRGVLDGTVGLTVNSDFNERKFGRLDSFDYESYPIYEKLLRIKIKPRVLEYEKKFERILRAVPRIQTLFQSLCHVPYLCAESILWNMSIEELDRFVLFDC